MEENNYEFLFKIVLIGDSLTGKTNLLQKYINNEFDEYSKPTVGVELGSKILNIKNHIIKARIWDIAGSERYRVITSAYYKGSGGAFVVYDITNKKSFESLENHVNEVRKANNNISIFIIGNKSDSEEERQISKEEGEAKSQKLNAKFLETSAKTGENVQKAFEMLMTEIYEINTIKDKLNNKIEINEIIIEESLKNEEEQEDEHIEINKKCSLNEHKEKDAIIHCQECKIYMCHQCEKVHLGLCKDHHSYKLDNNINNIFTGICKKKNHSMKLEYYCKTHNKLCCAGCIAKIKGHGNGFHNDCEIYYINDIKKEKKEKLNKNIIYLEELSKNLDKSLNELKIIYEEMKNKKEELKKNIQTIFTKLRNIINETEDKLLYEVENKFKKLLFNEKIIKESEKLPNQIKINLEQGKLIHNDENNWEDSDKLNKIINDCINLENNIQDINIINESIIKAKKLKPSFNIDENKINELSTILRNIGKVNYLNSENN